MIEYVVWMTPTARVSCPRSRLTVTLYMSARDYAKFYNSTSKTVPNNIIDWLPCFWVYQMFQNVLCASQRVLIFL